MSQRWRCGRITWRLQSKMADSSPANSIIEGTVKFRDGKKVREKNLINITVFSVEQLTLLGPERVD